MIGYRLVKYRAAGRPTDLQVKMRVHPVLTDSVTSIFKFAYHWKPGLNTAACISPYNSVLLGLPPTKHETPNEECMCGFYAWKDVLAALEESGRRGQVGPLVMLKIAGSGKIIEHEHGWRAAEVTPLAALWTEGYSTNNEATIAVAELLEIPLENVDVEYELDSVQEWIAPDSRTMWVAEYGKNYGPDLTRGQANKLFRELYGEHK